MFLGTLSPNTMDKEVYRAFRAFHAQKRRCYCRTSPDYKYYGAKGVRVKYKVREFISWWLAHPKKVLRFERLSVDRKNSKGHYELGNIRLIPLGQNVAEANRRTKAKPIIVYLAASMTPVLKCRSIQEAMQKTGCSYRKIAGDCELGLRATRRVSTLTFRWGKKRAN